MTTHTLLPSLWLAMLCLGNSAIAAPASRPNIVFILADDPAEKEHLIQAHPDVVKELRAALNAIRSRKHSRTE